MLSPGVESFQRSIAGYPVCLFNARRSFLKRRVLTYSLRVTKFINHDTRSDFTVFHYVILSSVMYQCAKQVLFLSSG